MAGTTGLEPATSDVTGRRSTRDSSRTTIPSDTQKSLHFNSLFNTASIRMRFDFRNDGSKARLGDFEEGRLSVNHEFFGGNPYPFAPFWRPVALAFLIVFSCRLDDLCRRRSSRRTSISIL